MLEVCPVIASSPMADITVTGPRPGHTSLGRPRKKCRGVEETSTVLLPNRGKSRVAILLKRNLEDR